MPFLELPKLYHPDFADPRKKPRGAVELNQLLSRALVFDVEMTEGGGRLRDLVSGKWLDQNGHSWGVNSRGNLEATFAGGGDYSASFVGLEALNGTSHTIHVRARINAFDTNGMVICGWNDNGSHFWQVDDTLTSVFIGGTSTPDQAHEGATNNYQDWFFISDGTANTRSFFENGVRLNHATGSVNLPTGSKTFHLGRWIGSPNFSLDGGIEFCRIWNRALTDAERLSLTREPYSLFKPSAPQYVFFGSGGGVTPIGKSFDARWSILNYASKSTNFQWSIRNAVQKSSDLQWGILSTAGKSIDLRHSILEAVGKSSDLRWDILSALATVGKSIDARWDILTTAGKDLDARWSILNAIFKNVDLRYDVLAAVAKYIDLHWDVLSSITTVGTSLDLQWTILATVARSLDSQWDILGSVGKDLDIRWEVITAVSKDADFQWALLQSAGKQIDVRWDQIATVGNEIQLRWRIESDSSFPDITGIVTINSVTKQITLSSKTPIITIQ